METDISRRLQEQLLSLRSTLCSQPSPAEPFDYRREAIEDEWNSSLVTPKYSTVEPFGERVGWSYVFGQVGSGKTHLATSMLRRFLEDETVQCEGCPIWFTPRVRFVTAPDYLDMVRASYDDRGDTRAEGLKTCDMLVLDDLGQEAPTPWACSQLYGLVNDRYCAGKPMIVTSQFQPDSIARRLSRNGGREQAEAIVSRFVEVCRFYRLDDSDRRADLRRSA